MKNLQTNIKSNNRATKLKGFSIIELLVVLSIVMILGAFSAPQISTWILKVNIDTEVSQLRSALALARSEAIIRNKYTFVESYINDWNSGWNVVIDNDSSGTYTTGDEIIKQRYQSFTDFELVWSQNGLVRYGFNPRGLPSGVSAVTAKFCPTNSLNNNLAQGISISFFGRTRIVSASNVNC